MLFLERKSIKKNIYFEPEPIAVPEFSPGNVIALLIEEQYDPSFTEKTAPA